MRKKKAHIMIEDAHSKVRIKPAEALRLAEEAIEKAVGDKDIYVKAKLVGSEAAMFLEDYEKMFELSEEAYTLAVAMGESESVREALNNSSIAAVRTGRFSTAYKKQLEILRSIDTAKDKSELLPLLASMADLFFNVKNLSASLDCWQQHLLIAEELQDTAQIVFALGKLASLCRIFEMKAEAKAYALQEIGLRETNNIIEGIEKAYLLVAGLESAERQYDKALTLFEKALPIFKENNDIDNIVQTLLGAATAYQASGKKDKAMQYVLEGLEAAVTDNHRTMLLIRRASLYKAMTRFQDAKEDLLEALASAQAAENPDDEETAYKVLSTVYSATGDFKAAYNWIVKSELSREAAAKRKEQEVNTFLPQQLELLEIQRELLFAPPAVMPVRKSETIERGSGDTESDAAEKKRGRPKGSKNKQKMAVSPEVAREAARMLQALTEAAPETVKVFAPEVPLTAANIQVIYKDFLLKLRREYPELTGTEAKIACLVKEGMRTKEIATIFESSPHTVDTHRRRLRKKIGLGDHKDLNNALLQMEREWGLG